MPVSQANAARSVFFYVLLCWHWAHEESEITRNGSMHNAEVFAVVCTAANFYSFTREWKKTASRLE